MTDTLIIKSSSMERLDALVDALRSGVDGLEGTTILTHPHWATAISRNYPETTPVPYPFDGGFNRANAATLRGKSLKERYDRVIVLVSNLSGAGHDNVLDAASLFGDQLMIFNVNGDLVRRSPAKIRRERLLRKALLPVALSGTLLIGVLFGGLLALLLALRSPYKSATYDGDKPG